MRLLLDRNRAMRPITSFVCRMHNVAQHCAKLFDTRLRTRLLLILKNFANSLHDADVRDTNLSGSFSFSSPFRFNRIWRRCFFNCRNGNKSINCSTNRMADQTRLYRNFSFWVAGVRSHFGFMNCIIFVSSSSFFSV